MPLAARIGDHHTCPKIEPGPMSHVGGAMVSAGCPSVRIGDRPAAREGDHAICAVALDRVRLGEPSVLIGDRPAARAGDPTDHGGVVAAGAPNVLIGSSSQAITLRKAAAKGAAFCEECARMQRESKPKAAPRQPAPGAAAKVVLVTPVMGRLSAAYETSGQGPGATAHTEGDYGGASYGTYQISTAVGTMTSFLEWLKAAHPEWRTRLRAHPQGSGAFDRVWKAIAAEEPQAFFDAQHDFVQDTHYGRADTALRQADPRWQFDTRSQAVRDALWSTAVQHGPKGAVTVLTSALRKDDPATLDDATLLKRIYAERGADQGRKYFSKSSAAVRASVVNRFKNELADALKMLATEQATATPREGT